METKTELKPEAKNPPTWVFAPLLNTPRAIEAELRLRRWLVD